MDPPAAALPDGLYAVVEPAWVAGFVVEHHHVTMCAPILRRRLTHWMGQARLVSPVPDGTAPHRPTVPGHSAPEAALEVDPAQPARRRVLVTGSRTWTDTSVIRDALAEQWAMGCAHCHTEHTTDAWAPMQLTWSVIRPGDIILAARTRLPWIVTTVTGTEVTAVRGAATHRATPDHDAAVNVLVPLVERNALVAARDGLGAQIVDRSGPR